MPRNVDVLSGVLYTDCSETGCAMLKRAHGAALKATPSRPTGSIWRKHAEI